MTFRSLLTVVGFVWDIPPDKRPKSAEIYVVFPSGHKNSNERAMAFLEKDVTVTGTVHRKGGLKGITICEIKERTL